MPKNRRGGTVGFLPYWKHPGIRLVSRRRFMYFIIVPGLCRITLAWGAMAPGRWHVATLRVHHTTID